MKLYVLEVNFLNDSMGFNKRLLCKRKVDSAWESDIFAKKSILSANTARKSHHF